MGQGSYGGLRCALSCGCYVAASLAQAQPASAPPALADEVVATGRRADAPTEPTALTKKLVRLPGNFGDPLRAVTALPGVVQISEGGGPPAVRGSSPEDNAFLVDGLPADTCSTRALRPCARGSRLQGRGGGRHRLREHGRELDLPRRRRHGRTVKFDTDTPVIANIVLNYQLTPTWNLGLRWQYRSGLPYTPIVGNEENPDYPGFYRPVYGDLNAERAGAYHRLDVRFERPVRMARAEGLFYVDIVNAYGRRNTGAAGL
ncbi:MAG TPA: hypothetical protein VF200_09710 [Woeseiaceae bacterium]